MTVALSAEAYEQAFVRERECRYPVVEAFEQRCGYAIPLTRLEDAARVLACPVKANPPNWQHGRVLYSAASQRLADVPRQESVRALDIGTAKGFSALCLQWAIADTNHWGYVDSVDVIDPAGAVSRNTIAEVDGLKTLADIHRTLPVTCQSILDIRFHRSTGIEWLKAHDERLHLAFVDGKHSGTVVRQEGVLLTARQQTGDLAIFDDVHIPDVSVAVNSLHFDYRIEYLEVLPNRHYAIARRR